MPISEVYNMDCMEYMKGIPDKFFDLAIVDPQYGIDIMHKEFLVVTTLLPIFLPKWVGLFGIKDNMD